jgi:hypothetical protein
VQVFIEGFAILRPAKLGVSANAIKRFNADALMLHLENVSSYDHSTGTVIYNFNPVEKISELYERMLKEKNAEIEELRKRLSKK